MMQDKVLIVQSDFSILAEANHPRYKEVQSILVNFAELKKSPEHIHTYKISPLSIWNARSLGISSQEIIETLQQNSRYPIQETLLHSIKQNADRFGKIRLVKFSEDTVALVFSDRKILEEVLSYKDIVEIIKHKTPDRLYLDILYRGVIKQKLINVGCPVEDVAGYAEGDTLDILLRSTTSKSGEKFSLRDYQKTAIDSFYQNGAPLGGAGVLTLPCGSGKTIIGIGIMSKIGAPTLILTTSVTSVNQWLDEILDKTKISKDLIGGYTSKNKAIKPITVTTYQMITHKVSKDGAFENMKIFNARNWGLIIYDEVHALPAPIFQITSSLQAKRRLGLTATLIREDGKEKEVFSLIGPKKADVSWKKLENENWIASAICTEVLVPMCKDLKLTYLSLSKRERFAFSAKNPNKFNCVKQLLKKHNKESILIIGMYIDQIKEVAAIFNIPLLTGSSSQAKRDLVYKNFKEGKNAIIAVSKIANFAVDLPDASVAIQISGTFGSRQEEAQRLGRILRPKSDRKKAYFYSLVTQDSVEEDFNKKRQLFLCEQGYEYRFIEADI